MSLAKEVLNMGLSSSSVAEIYCPSSGSVGSGYFCTSRLVLTARHVVSGALTNLDSPELPPTAHVEEFLQTLAENSALCRVRPLDAGRGVAFLDAVPVWWSADADVALLALTAPRSRRGGEFPPITWADVPESDPIDVTAVGFPEADAEKGIRESRQLSGQLNPLSGVKAGRFVIHARGSIGQTPAGARSSWAGMSGAALFSEDALIGMVLVDADATHPERLELWALPARTFAEEPSFLSWIRWDGGEGSWSRSKEAPSSPMALLKRIAEANKQLPILGNEVVMKINAALESRSQQTNDTETRRAVSTVLSMLRSKNVLYAKLENEIWEYVFASLRELRKALADTHATIVVNGPQYVAALVEVMLTAVRDYLGRHETPYTRYMAENRQREPVPRWEGKWPGLHQAALELVALREVLVGAITPLNAFAQKEDQIGWKSESHIQNYFLAHTSPAETIASASASRTPRAESVEERPLSTIIAALRSDVLSIRVAAVDELSKRKGSQVVAALIETLEDEEILYRYPEDAIAARCWEALRKSVIGQEHLPPLMRLASKSAKGLELLAPFADKPEIMRMFVARIENGLEISRCPAIEAAFEKYGEAAVPELSRLLLSENEITRRIGASLLCKTDELLALPKVLDYLARVGEKERSDLTFALWEFSDQRAVLEVALSHGSHFARAAAVRVAAYSDSMSVIDLLERAAADPHPEVRSEVMKRIEGWRGRHSESPKVVALVKNGLTDSDPHVRKAAALASYAAFSVRSASQLTPLLKDRNSSVRAEVARLLGYCADPLTTKQLVAAARDRNSYVRGHVIKALVQLAKHGGVNPEIFVLALDDRSSEVRCEAIDGLAALSHRGAVPELCKKLTDENEWVRRQAVFALSSIGEPSAVPCLANALDGADELTKRDIIKALARFGTDEAFAILLELARRDPSEYGLADALMYTRDHRALPVLEIIRKHAGSWREQIEYTLRGLRAQNADGES